MNAIRNNDNETRDAWVKSIARRLTELLASERPDGDPLYSEAECKELAELLHDLPSETKRGAMRPEEVVLEKLLQMQGIEYSTAHIVARALPRLDMNRLLAPASLSADLLGFTAITLGRHRRGNTFQADVVHGTETRAETIAYRFERLLRVIAADRHRTMLSGPGNLRFEKPD